MLYWIVPQEKCVHVRENEQTAYGSIKGKMITNAHKKIKIPSEEVYLNCFTSETEKTTMHCIKGNIL